MKQLVEVTFKDGSKAKVLPGEVEGLRKAGLLKNPVKKEEKKVGETKEYKEKGQTKKANISTKNVKGGRPKKT